MLRQRVRARSYPIARVAADAVVVVFALALLCGGAMVVALALKRSPATIDGLSGYRTAYDYVTSLGPQDVGRSTRLIVAGAGLAACLIFGFLAWRAVPRPYLARTDLRIAGEGGGRVEIKARAIERAAEIAALEVPAVAGARARYATDDLTLHVSAGHAEALGAMLQDVHERVRDSLARHELPPLPVNITLVRLERQHRREPQ